MTEEIVAPMPGTFYRAPSPGQPPYKMPGDSVSVGDTIGMIEVMKTFTPIQAESAGKIIQFLVEDSEPVMPGQPLAEIEV